MKIVKCKDGNVMLILSEVEDASDKVIKANAVDASFEKHVPQYKNLGDKVEIYVNHVMEEDHYIEWLLVDYGDEQVVKYFHPNEEPKVVVDFREGMKAYSYCNKHSLWMNGEIQ